MDFSTVSVSQIMPRTLHYPGQIHAHSNEKPCIWGLLDVGFLLVGIQCCIFEQKRGGTEIAFRAPLIAQEQKAYSADARENSATAPSSASLGSTA